MIGEGAAPRFGPPWPISAEEVTDAVLEIDHLGRTLPSPQTGDGS